MRTLILLLSIGYLLSQAFDAVLRWMLNLGGAEPLIYLRDYSLILVIIFGCYLLMRENRSITRLFCVLWTLALSACIALFAGVKLPQVLFGLKVWLPFVTGFLLVETGLLPALNRPRAWALLWAVTCIGVGINYFYRYPWTATLIQVGDVTVTGERGATAMGIARLSGFTRANFDAATLVLLLYIYLLLQTRNTVARILLTLLSGLVIALTTTKGALSAFLTTLLLAPALSLVRRSHSGLSHALCAAMVVMALVGLVFPLVSVEFPFPRLQPGSVGFWLFASFVDRATNTWPHAWSLISDWQLITGRGLGGIGAAQEMFERGRANPADNMFVYFYVTAGLFGAALYLFYAFASFRLELQERHQRLAYLLLFAFFAYGLTVNMIENAPAAMVLGGLTCVLLSPVRQPQMRHAGHGSWVPA
jgi:hypothetical protein